MNCRFVRLGRLNVRNERRQQLLERASFSASVWKHFALSLATARVGWGSPTLREREIETRDGEKTSPWELNDWEDSKRKTGIPCNCWRERLFWRQFGNHFHPFFGYGRAGWGAACDWRGRVWRKHGQNNSEWMLGRSSARRNNVESEIKWIASSTGIKPQKNTSLEKENMWVSSTVFGNKRAAKQEGKIADLPG